MLSDAHSSTGFLFFVVGERSWDGRLVFVNDNSWGWSDVGVVVNSANFIVIPVVVEGVPVVEVWIVIIKWAVFLVS